MVIFNFVKKSSFDVYDFYICLFLIDVFCLFGWVLLLLEDDFSCYYISNII